MIGVGLAFGLGGLRLLRLQRGGSRKAEEYASQSETQWAASGKASNHGSEIQSSMMEVGSREQRGPISRA